MMHYISSSIKSVRMSSSLRWICEVDMESAMNNQLPAKVRNAGHSVAVGVDGSLLILVRWHGKALG
jgi:hypothetical protein